MQPFTHKLEVLDIKQTPRFLVVSIADQSLELSLEDGSIRRFAISTGALPPSCIENSQGTPTGLHRIARKIGDGAPAGTVFCGRVSIGKRFDELSDEERRPNLVTTRILWLEPGHNQGAGRDSFQRYIYIHGSNHEDRIGTPSSGGCVLLRNAEMIELYDLAREGDLVFIA